MINRTNRSAIRRFIYNPTNIVGLIIVIGMVLIGIFAPSLAPSDPYKQHIAERLTPPSWYEGGNSKYILGTEQLGRDIASRLIYGARISITVSFISVMISALLGIVPGLLAAFYPGYLRTIIMRLADVQIAFPFLVLAIFILAVLGRSLINLILILAVWGWPSFARVTYSMAILEMNKEYIIAARSIGCQPVRIILRHLLPNVIPPVVVIGSFNIAYMIIAESSLSFLGLGVPPPTPSWGSMISDGRVLVNTAWWVVTFPGLAILITVLGVNMVGDGLREILDPRFKT